MVYCERCVKSALKDEEGRFKCSKPKCTQATTMKASRLIRNFLSHMSFKHTCIDDGDEQIMTYTELQAHVLLDCQRHKNFKCACSDSGMTKLEYMEHLLNECQDALLPCVFCQQQIKRGEFEQHR